MFPVDGSWSSAAGTGIGRGSVICDRDPLSPNVAPTLEEPLKPCEVFTTTAGEVHNVKNASSSTTAKALAFYAEKKSTKLEDLSVPSK